MSTDPTTQSVLFPNLFSGKQVVAKFDQAHSSSDGGAILLKAIDEKLGLSERLARCIDDPRQPGKVRHAIEELLRQRVFGIACGYEDANDAARIADDPVHKLLAGRSPIEGESLASQPTLSRFENGGRRSDLYRMGDALADAVVGRHRQRLRGKARRITIDMDPTDDPTHGQQEFAFFNGHYGSWCYLPMVATLTFNDESEQYLVAAVLRPGNAPSSQGAIGILRRLLVKLRTAFPKARLRPRTERVVVRCPIDIVCHIDLGVAIAIQIATRCAAAPESVRQPSLASDLGKRPVSLILKKQQAAVPRHQYV